MRAGWEVGDWSWWGCDSGLDNGSGTVGLRRETSGHMNYFKICFLRLLNGISARALLVPPFVSSLNQVLL